MATYTPRDLAKARLHRDVTPNGVAFDWWLASSAGAGFALLREPQHTDDAIELAKWHLRRDRDVVTLAVRLPQSAHETELEEILDWLGIGVCDWHEKPVQVQADYIKQYRADKARQPKEREQ